MSESYYLSEKEQHESDFVVDKFGFCGCYELDVVDDIIRVLKELNKEHISNYITGLMETLKLDREYIMLILMVLDEKEYTEHGSTLRGSWITPEGKEILKEWDEIQNE